MFKRILVGMDGSDHACDAAMKAIAIAEKFDAELCVVSVFDASSVYIPNIGLPGAMPEPGLNLQDFAHHAFTAVEHQAEELLKDTKLGYRMFREFGHPADRIVATAKDEQCDLIVMGQRGLSGFQSFLLGSVSSTVLQLAGCPVLIVQ